MIDCVVLGVCRCMAVLVVLGDLVAGCAFLVVVICTAGVFKAVGCVFWECDLVGMLLSVLGVS